jgi:hypothetical protein
MKKTLKNLAAALLVFTLFYLIGAFIEVSFVITKWREDARILVACFGGIFAIVILGNTYFDNLI